MRYDHTNPTLGDLALERAELAQRMAEETAAMREPASAGEAPAPVGFGDRTKNALRPATLDAMLGQHEARAMMRRVIDATIAIPKPLDHVLLVGASGCGKSTFAHTIAGELGVDCYQIEAPISHETLLALREVMQDGDVLFLDEIHQQAIGERRGKSTSTQPEVLFGVMEDRTLVSDAGVLDFPEITIVGATTDEGMLPDPFINRFPIRPYIAAYALEDLRAIARSNAETLGLVLSVEAETKLAGAARGVPRQINNYVKNAELLAAGAAYITPEIADEVLHVLNRVTDDGLTADMQNTLTFLYQRCKRTSKDGETRFQASVNTISTAIGKSRDTKAVMLRVEPYLITTGLLQVAHGGRVLTDAGIGRAIELLAA